MHVVYSRPGTLWCQSNTFWCLLFLFVEHADPLPLTQVLHWKDKYAVAVCNIIQYEFLCLLGWWWWFVGFVQLAPKCKPTMPEKELHTHHAGDTTNCTIPPGGVGSGPSR